MKELGPAWRVLVLLALAIHGGTALLRLNTFWPYPRLVDFGAFYAGAWILRQGGSPYPWPQGLGERLAAESGLVLGLPRLNSLPLWPWLLQPLTLLPFPAAAWLWLLLNLGLLAGCTLLLAQIARITGPGRLLILFGLVLTFGPVTLSLTLGQTAPLLLALVLLLGRGLARPRRRSAWTAVPLWIAGVATKLFPMFWLPGLALLRAWRILAGGLLALGLLAGLHWLLLPRITRSYATAFLPAQARLFARAGLLDDQSLGAWILRLSQPMRLEVPGLQAFQRRAVSWPALLPLGQEAGLWIGVLLVGLLSLAVAWLLWRRGSRNPEGAFYLWVLTGLLAFPHTERYNHALLLPALAWLWGRGGRARNVVAVGYLLAGLARLTHLWVQVLPWPWAPLATGFGVLAVTVLMAGMASRLSRPPLGGAA